MTKREQALQAELAVFDTSRIEILGEDGELWDAARSGFVMRPRVAPFKFSLDEVKAAARSLLPAPTLSAPR